MSDMRQFVATPTVEELEAEIERLRAVVDAAKDLTSERAYWNPDTGNYDLHKSNGTLDLYRSQLIEALAALEEE